MSQSYSLNTDGGSRGNPGKAAIGVIIKNEEKKTIHSHKEFIGMTTNNVAEYSALVKGLETCLEMNIKNLDVFMDSELIIKQIKGEYRVKDSNMHRYFEKVQMLIENFASITFNHVKREFNKEADKLVNEALDAI